MHDGDTTVWPNYSTPGSGEYQSGVSYTRSQVTMAMVERGTSHIICLGEKYLDPRNYTSGEDCGDNEELFVGQDNDLFRTTDVVPHQDFAGEADTLAFGSAHPGGCNFSAGDGSIHFVSYDVDKVIFQAFGVRTPMPVAGTIWADQ